MEDGSVVLVETGKIDGRNWRDSHYAVAIFYKGRFYADDIFEEYGIESEPETWDITDYVIDYTDSGWSKYLDLEMREYLDNGIL
jgi:ABC-type glycerol-3-phosphate transport system substrate-binding protein